MRRHLHRHHPAVLAEVPTFAGLHHWSVLLQLQHQRADVFFRPDVGNAHRQEFAPGIAIIPDGRAIYFQEKQRFHVIYPGGMWIVFEQNFEAPFALCHLALSSYQEFAYKLAREKYARDESRALIAHE